MRFAYKEYECGCEITSDNMEAFEIEYCPLHRSAPDLYEALKPAVEVMDKRSAKTEAMIEWLLKAKQAIAKVES